MIITTLTTNKNKTWLDDQLLTKKNSSFIFSWTKWNYTCNVVYSEKIYTLKITDPKWNSVFTTKQESKESLRSKLIAIMTLWGFREDKSSIESEITKEITF